MIIRISLNETIRESNPNIDIEDHFDDFVKLVDFKGDNERNAKALALFFDYGSPLAELTDIDERFSRIEKLFDFTEDEYWEFRMGIAGFSYNNPEKCELIYNAVTDYCKNQNDLAKQFKEALSYQVSNLSNQLKGLKIDITSDKDEKSFERFHKLSDDSNKIYGNIHKLEDYEKKDEKDIAKEIEEKLNENEKQLSGVSRIQKKVKEKQNGGSHRQNQGSTS